MWAMSVAVDDHAPRLRGRELLRAVAEGTAGTVGEAFLRGLVRHVAEAFGARLAFVAEANPEGTRARFLEAWYDGAPLDEHFEYETEGTPCALMAERGIVAFPDALGERFPEDRYLIELGLESYVAVCLTGADGTHLGHLAVLDARRMEAHDDDVAALRIFAARAAAELERQRQAAALEASRTRAIAAADGERRRIGRDLHDGAQQRLMAVANFLTVARKKAGPEAEPLLALAAEELSLANAELRELARGLYPVALAERGLRGALESLTAGCAVPVELDVPELELPERAALAAYFVVCESLTNVTRYAGARRARVRAGAADGALCVEVSDDGAGGADPAAGTGLRGLADRMQILGGSLDVVSPAGAGTRVTARIPLGAS
jgi:signal transduction histidine kinase